MPPAVAVVAAAVGGALASSAAVVAVVGTFGAAIVGGIVATGINMLGNKVLGTDKPKAAANAEDSGIMVNVQDNVASIPIIYGRRRVAGRQIYATTSGAGNKFLHLVYAVAEGEIQEIERICFGDNEIVFDGQVTPMTATSGTLTADKARGKFTNFVELQWRLGTSTQTAFTSLVADTAGQEGSWTGNHKALGVALIYIKVAYDKDKMNQVPTVYCDIKGKKVVTSFGGGATWSDNPAACVLDYLTNTTYGKGLALSDIDQTSFNEVRDYCDEVINLYTDGSTVMGKRYLCNGFLDPDTPVFDNIKSLLSCFNGYLLWANGKYKIKVFKDEVNTGFTFDESNILGDIAMQLNSKETLANRVKASFYNSGLDYAQDYAIWEDEDLRNQEDNGEILELEIGLPFTNDYTRALNLCKMSMEQSRLGTTVSFQATPDALRVEVGDHVWFSHPYLGFQDDYRVTGMTLNPDKTVSVTLIQYDDNIYSLDKISTAPGPSAQDRNIRFNGGATGIEFAELTNIQYSRYCPGATLDVDQGYKITCDVPTTGYKGVNFVSITSTAVNITAETITSVGHGLQTGDDVLYNPAPGNLSNIGGLTVSTHYFVIRIDADTFKLALTSGDATAGTAINLTSQGTGTFVFYCAGVLVPFDQIAYYTFVADGDSTVSFTSNTNIALVPATAWPTGTVTLTGYAVSTDNVPGRSGTGTYVQNTDPATLCPPSAPTNMQSWFVCDGAGGAGAKNSIGGQARGAAGGVGDSQALYTSTGTAKIKVRWTHGIDVALFTSYTVYAVMSHPSTGTFYTSTQTFTKAAGATATSQQTETLTSLVTFPSIPAGAATFSIAVEGNTGTATSELSEASSLIFNPDVNTDCWLGTVQFFDVYQVCTGTGGTSTAHTASPAYTGILSNFGANVTSKMGWKIKHGYDYPDTVNYEIWFTVTKDGTDIYDFQETFTRSASATYNTGGANDYQTYTSTNTVTWPDPSTFTNLTVAANVRSKNGTAIGPWIDYRDWITNPTAGENCL